MNNEPELAIHVVEIPDDVFYEAAGLAAPEMCGVCFESSKGLTDEIGPLGLVKVCNGCRVE